jgi:hypothetical protein
MYSARGVGFSITKDKISDGKLKRNSFVLGCWSVRLRLCRHRGIVRPTLDEIVQSMKYPTVTDPPPYGSTTRAARASPSMSTSLKSQPEIRGEW